MRKIAFIILLCCAACQNKPADTVRLFLDKGEQQVKVSGLPVITLHGLQRDSMPVTVWQNLFPVCAMPADTDMRNYQQPLSGSYRVTDSTLVFNPDTPFIQGQTYFVRFYRYDRAITPTDLLLQRRTPGRGTCIELIFKY